MNFDFEDDLGGSGTPTPRAPRPIAIPPIESLDDFRKRVAADLAPRQSPEPEPPAQDAPPAPAAPPDGFELKWHGDSDDAPLKEWLVAQTLPKVGKALIAGQWGTYKTFIALDLSASVMTRTPFAGRRVDRQGGILFIAAEGQDEVRVRLEGLAIDKVAPVAEQDGATAVDPAKMPFVWVEKCPQLTADDAIPKLRKIVSAAAAGMMARFGLPLVMIAIDTLMPAAGFRDANDASETQRVMSVLTAVALEFQLLVLAVDHFGKDVTTGTRNSSVKEDAVDAVLALLAERDVAGKVTNPRLAIGKVRGAATGQEVPFSVREVVVHENAGHDAVTTLVINWGEGTKKVLADAPTTTRGKNEIELLKLEMIKAYERLADDIEPSPALNGAPVRKLAVENLRDELKSRGLLEAKETGGLTNVSRTRFHRAKTELISASRFVGLEGLIWII